MSAANSGGSRRRTAAISATSRSSVPNTPPHLRPGRLRLDPHPLGDPTDELVGAKGLAGRRASLQRRLQLMGQPRAQRPQLVMVHPLGQYHHRRPGHPLGRGPVQGRRCLHLLQQLGVLHTPHHPTA
jgi:hypothetical protein